MYNMSVRSGINKQDLLNCDDDEDNENEKLKEFYERNLQFLKKYPPATILADIARTIHKTILCNKVEWMDYAASLGITDVDILDKIEERAELYKELQLFIVFTRVLPKTKRFDHVIRMLIEKERFDVLKKIYTVSEGLIAESRRSKVKGHLMIEPEYGSECLTSTACSIHEFESETTSDSSCRTEIMNDDSTVYYKNLKQNLTSEKEIVPSVPSVQESMKGTISVFIQHTKPDTDYAVQLSTKLKNAGFKVKTMSDMDVILAINDTEALAAIFQEVDFIIPVISERLLKQIHAANKQFDSDDADNNKYFHQLIMQEYKKNNCCNYKVRPVILPGMTKQKLKQDIVLSFPFRFGIEDDKLIKVLKETKDILPRYCLRVNNA